MYTCINIICVLTQMHLDFLSSAAQTMVDLELCLGQSVVDYMYISSFYMNIYYYFEQGLMNSNCSSLALINQF